MAKFIDQCKGCGRVDVRVSWSSLKAHEECRQRAKLIREGKRAKMKDVRVFFPGRVTDRVVRNWLSSGGSGSIVDLVEPTIDHELNVEMPKESVSVTWKSTTDRQEVLAACKSAAERIEPALEKYVLPYEWNVDFGFRTPVLMRDPWGHLGRVVLNGYMDIIVRNPQDDSWRIYDVKHTMDSGYWRGSFGQLIFYSYENLIRTTKMPVEVGFFQPLVEERVKRFLPTSAHVNALASRVQSMAYDIWSNSDEPRKDGKFCGFCEVKHACAKFKPMVASDGKFRVSLGGKGLST